jgi:hypothetical protein
MSASSAKLSAVSDCMASDEMGCKLFFIVGGEYPLILN